MYPRSTKLKPNKSDSIQNDWQRRISNHQDNWFKLEGVCVCLMGEVRWRDAMRERHHLRLAQFRCQAGLMSPKLDDAPPPRSLPQNRIFHGKLTVHTGSAVPTTITIILCLFSWSYFLFVFIILKILLSWVDCPNILSLDYSWCFAEGGATGLALALILFPPWPPCLL